MIDADRLDELGTLGPDPDFPDNARLVITAADLRDLVKLIPIVRGALHWHDQGDSTLFFSAVASARVP